MLLRLLPFALSALVLLPFAAHAEEMLVGTTCSSTADCPLAFACETVDIPCYDTPVDCECAPCEPDTVCEPCDCGGREQGGGGPDCTTTSAQHCVFRPQSCTADADCTTAGFVCQAQEECSGGGGCACPGCPAGEECPPCDCDDVPDEVDCVVTGGYCLPPLDACESDADCTNGWSCTDLGYGGSSDGSCEICECVSSGGTGERGGDDETGGDGGTGGTDEGDCTCRPCEEDPTYAAESVCLPAGWDAQLEAMMSHVGGGEYGGGGTRGEDNGGVGAPEQAAGDDDLEDEEAPLGCNAAGAGAVSLLPLATLGLLRRRRG